MPRHFSHVLTSGLFLGPAIVLSSSCTQEAKVERALSKAKEALEKNDLQVAEIEFKNVLDLDPSNKGALRGLGMTWGRQGAALEAGQILMGAKEKFPEDSELRIQLAKSLGQLLFLGSARNELIEVLKKDPKNGEAAISLVDFSLSPELLGECEDILEPGVNAGDPEFLIAAALLEMRRGARHHGSSLLEKAMAKTPDSPRGLALKAVLLETDEKSDEAEAAFKAAVKASDPYSNMPLNYANYLQQKGRVADAKAVLEDVRKATPDFLPPAKALAAIAASENDWAKVEELVKPVLSKSPYDIEAGQLQAQAYLRKKESKSAVEQLEGINARFPGRAVLELALAKALLAHGNSSRAATVLDAAIRNAPSSQEAVGLRAEVHLQHGEPVEAVQLLEEFTKTSKVDARLGLLLARAYEADLQLQKAQAVLKQLTKADDKNITALLELARIDAKLGEAAEARATYESVLAADPANLSAVTQLTYLDAQEKGSETAHARIDRFIAEHKDNAEARIVKAILFDKKDGKPEQAIKQCEEALKIKPNLESALVYLVQLKVALGQGEAAIVDAKKLAEQSPENQAAWIQLGTLYHEAGKLGEAKEIFDKVLKLNPESATVFNNLAYLELKSGGDTVKALEYARKARALEPGSGAIADTLGIAEMAAGNYRAAIAPFQQAADQMRDDPSVAANLAKAQYMCGMLAAAKENFEKALASKADFPDKAEAETRLGILKNPKDETALRARTEQDPKDAVAWLSLGNLALAAKNYDSALDHFNKATAVNEELEAGYVGISIASLGLNQTKAALDAANRARQIAPRSAEAAAALARANMKERKFLWAYDLLNEAVVSLPGNADLLRDLAITSHAIGRTEQAREALSKWIALKAEPSAEVFVKLLDRSTDPESASAMAAEAKPGDPHFLAAQFAIANSVQEASPRESAFKKLLEQAPDFDPAKLALARILVADPGRAKEATELLNECRERSATSSEFLTVEALVASRNAEYDLAAQLLTRIAESRPLSADEHFALGMAQKSLGKPEEAKMHLTEAIKGMLHVADQSAAEKALSEINS
jgi:tetratricopeptide (TPR) repeat protein